MKNYLVIFLALFSVTVFANTGIGTPITLELEGISLPCVACNNSVMVSNAGNDSNKVHHIMAPDDNRHNWNKIHATPTWSKVSADILTVLNNGAKVKYGSTSGVYKKISVVKGFTVEVVFREFSDGSCSLSDAWVKS